MLEFLKLNISWVKDIATLVFAGTATIIGILTYLRAKKTLLQPIRTETIKKQAELLTNFLKFLKQNDQSFEKGLDYVNLVQVNVLASLRDYGFVFSDQEKLTQNLSKNLVGWIPCGKSNQLKDVQVVDVFENSTDSFENFNLGKEKFENLKTKSIDIEKVYQTRTLIEFMKQVSEFSNDPFMPKSIQKTLTEFIDSVHYNLTIILKQEIETFILEFSELYFKDGKAPKFNSAGIYNRFNHSRKHHRPTISKLRTDIRRYLLIDEPW